MSELNFTYRDATRELDRILAKECNHHQYPETFDSRIKTCTICGHCEYVPSRESSMIFENTPSKRSHIKFDDSAVNRKYYSTPDNENRFKSTISPISPDNLLLLEAKHSANSVVSAFRELQAKASMIESEKTSACRLRDELRQQLKESKQLQAASRSRNESRSADHYVTLKTMTEEVILQQRHCSEKRTKLLEVFNHISSDITMQHTKISHLHDDIVHYSMAVKSGDERLHELKSSLTKTEQRIGLLERRVGSPDKAITTDMIQEDLKKMHEKINEEKILSKKIVIKKDALTRFLEIIMKVNSDLCVTLATKEETEKIKSKMESQKLKKALETQERELKFIMDSAEHVGFTKALEMTRQLENRNAKVNGVAGRYARPKSPQYDRALITAAARMAATAAAASVVAANGASHCSACPIKQFIPAGYNKNTEFNVVANVAKASRAAKDLNAKFASK